MTSFISSTSVLALSVCSEVHRASCACTFPRKHKHKTAIIYFQFLIINLFNREYNIHKRTYRNVCTIYQFIGHYTRITYLYVLEYIDIVPGDVVIKLCSSECRQCCRLGGVGYHGCTKLRGITGVQVNPSLACSVDEPVRCGCSRTRSIKLILTCRNNNGRHIKEFRHCYHIPSAYPVCLVSTHTCQYMPSCSCSRREPVFSFRIAIFIIKTKPYTLFFFDKYFRFVVLR